MGPRSLLLDTSILIRHLRSGKSQNTLLEDAWDQFDNLCISTISLYEIEAGAKSAGRLSDIEPLLEILEILPITRETAEESASIFAELRGVNQLIPHQDILIAGVARFHQMPLLTTNQKHFERVKDLVASSKIDKLI